MTGLSLIALSFIGCENSAVDEFSHISTEPNIETINFVETSELSKVAKVVSEVGLDLEMVKEMKKNVEQSLAKGRDEAVTFKEILSPNLQSARFSNAMSGNGESKFATKLRQNAPPAGTRSSAPGLLQAMETEGVNLYWPYSEHWDGVTMPVIAVSPEDDNQELCLAYKLKETENGFILDETIIVDEDYAMVNPVWVINYAEVIDAPNIIDTPRETYATSGIGEIGKEIATVYLGSFKSTKQHDPWHKGGSEYYVEASAPLHKEVNGKIEIINDNFFRTRITFTREEINNHTKRNFGFGLPIVTQWQKELDKIAFFVFENDASVFNGNVDLDLSATWKGQTYGLKVKLPFGSGDDQIAKITYTRDFLFSTNNYENSIWQEYTSDGVYWTLPFKVGTTIY